jgi:CRISPR-associated endoribonuclease Cas6
MMQENLGISLLTTVVRFIVKNDGAIQPRNVGSMHGAMLRFIEHSDPSLSKSLHEKGRRKPWSFSKPFFDVVKRNGINDARFLLVSGGTTGRFHVNTFDTTVHSAFTRAAMGKMSLRIGKLRCDVISVDSKKVQIVPPDPVMVFMTFHSPTLFREHDDGSVTSWFDVEKLVRFQHDAVTRNGLMEEPPVPVEDLVKMVAVERNDTRSSWSKLHRGGIDIRVNGFTGKVTLRLQGNDDGKRWLARALVASQCTGIGSRTSLGFGHCSVIAR